MADLFDDQPVPGPICIGEGAYLLPGYARDIDVALVQAIAEITARAPFRHMTTPGGFRMSVAMSSCGTLGWITDRKGYRYATVDPLTARPWPAMPALLLDLAARAAMQAGYKDFVPDACLINCYQPGARMSLHQDKDEQDAAAPIVSVSLGLPAVFLFGGAQRTDRAQRYTLSHGDVAVWGGPTRFHFHGVAALKEGQHALLHKQRINLTFRKVL